MGSRTRFRKIRPSGPPGRLRDRCLIAALLAVCGGILPLHAADSRPGSFDDLKIVYEKGSSYLESGYLQEAKEYFSRAIELNDAFGPAYHGLGIVNYLSGFLEESIANLEKAYELGIDNAKVNYVMAVAYTRLNEIKKARRSYNRALKLDPEFVQAYHNLGLLYYQDEQWDKARENLEKALALNPDNTKVIFALGLIHIKEGVPANAIEMITRLRTLRDETKAVKLESILRPPADAPRYLTEPDPSIFEPILPKPTKTPNGQFASSQSQDGRISITGRVQVTMQGASPDASQ